MTSALKVCLQLLVCDDQKKLFKCIINDDYCLAVKIIKDDEFVHIRATVNVDYAIFLQTIASLFQEDSEFFSEVNKYSYAPVSSDCVICDFYRVSFKITKDIIKDEAQMHNDIINMNSISMDVESVMNNDKYVIAINNICIKASMDMPTISLDINNAVVKKQISIISGDLISSKEFKKNDYIPKRKCKNDFNKVQNNKGKNNYSKRIKASKSYKHNYFN